MANRSIFYTAALVNILWIFQTTAFAQIPGLDARAVDLKIAIRIFDYANLAQNSREEMITEAGRIFLKAGIETSWVNCRNQQQNEQPVPACESPLGPTDLLLRILPGDIPQSAKLPETALGFAVVKREGGSMASVYLRRIEAIAQGGLATKGQLLGHAAAHEVGHLLLGTLEHSPSGIMKADWRGKTLDSIAKRDMLFNHQQAEYMQHQVQERQRRSAGLILETASTTP